MNFNNLTLKTQEALQKAQLLAAENGQQAIEAGHLLKGIMEVDDNVIPFVFKKMGANLKMVRQALDSIVQSYPKVSNNSNPAFPSRTTAEILHSATGFLKTFGDEYIALE
ncbi:MAG: Clp protease N-terminal domain-containing protein, partial [Bacteroidota bacterium]